jgi:SNF2 family DNA or RNA helicase
VSHHKTTVFSGLISLQFNICWLVTGTPIQNNVKEIYNLFCLLGVAVPSPRKGEDTDCYLGSLPIEKYVFQGTKAGVGLIIAPLSEHTETLQWANEEEREFAAHIHSLVPMCNVPIQDELAQSIFDSEDPRSTRMKYLARARKICTYPPGVHTAPHDGQGDETDSEAEEDDEASEAEASACETAAGQLPAGKVDAVMKTIVERQLNGNGKIIFCHYYDEIDAFEKRLLSLGLTVAKFDGRVPNGQRSKILNEPVDILLAQIKMCREGLNLQVNYNEVYFPSPHWNPAVESQAIARCWRIGQTKPVYVFRYLMAEPTPHDEKGSALSNPPPISDPTQAPSRGACEAVGTPTPFSIDEYTEKIQQRKKDIIEGLQIHAQLCV